VKNKNNKGYSLYDHPKYIKTIALLGLQTKTIVSIANPRRRRQALPLRTTQVYQYYLTAYAVYYW
jgi:hypothetical protein